MTRRASLAACLILLASIASTAAAQDAAEIVRAAWDHWRGESSHGEMTMTIHRPSWERSMSIEAWTHGTDRSLVRVTAPRKDAGNGTLIVDDSMWTYSPKINRVIKVPSSMMDQSWLGSDFSNKDIARSDDIVDEYDHAVKGRDEHEGHTVYVIESVPHENAAVVWGKEVLRIRDDHVLLSEQYYDQDGVLVKEMRTLEIGQMGGRTLGVRMRMAKADTEDEWTEVHYETIDFDLDLPENLFTRSNLRNPRE